MKQSLRVLLLALVAVTLVGFPVFGSNGVDKGVRKTATDDHYNYIDINTILMWVSNNGDGSFDPNTGIAGFYWPKGTAKTAIYEDGLLWGGFVNGELRVGGSTYRHGLQAGKILPDGSADNPDLEKYRVYKVRKDYQRFNDPNDRLYDPAEYAKLKKDYDEWPVGDGAPAMAYDSSSQQMFPKVGSGFPDEVLWFVSNDLNAAKTTYLYGTNPIGLEVQCTIWGYNQTGALGNMVFKKYRIINKSHNTVDSMFLAYWSDTDLGNANDDFSGCDTVLSLGYTYNGDPFDETYGVPPADGYDFFQGPMVRTGDPADSAIFDFQYRYGYKNLPMTAFTFYINGSAVYTDPTLGSPVGATQMYRYMNGVIGNTGQPFIDPLTGQPTKFCLAGDPLTGKGWLDGIVAQPGDRRMLMSSGPFTMAPGDTQEIVVAILIAQGSDRLSSVAVLKFYDKVAQQAYDNFFSLPTPPPAPRVRAIELDKKVVLDWGEDPAGVAATEHFSGKGFSFEGYNIYQMPSPSASREESKLLATYDKIDGVLKVWDYVFDAATGTIIQKPVQFGNDYGIQRSFVLDKDYLTDRALVNGTKYYVAVTSYAYNPDPNAVPNNLENPLQSQVITVVPHSPNPGVVYHNAPGDTLAATHSRGRSDGRVYPIVVDPSALNGHQYKVTFDSAGTTWYLTDVTTGQLVFTSKNLSGDGTGPIGSNTYYPVISGLQIVVTGPPKSFAGNGDGIVETYFAGNPATPDAAGQPYGGNKVWHSLNSPNSIMRYYLSAGGGDGDLDRLSRYIQYAVGRDFELRFTDAGGYGVYAFETDVIVRTPFELWDVTNNRRMIPFILSNDGNANKANWGWYTSADTLASPDPYFGYPASDWIYWMDPIDANGYANFAQRAAAVGAGNVCNYQTDYEPFINWYGGFVYPIGRLIVCNYSDYPSPPPSGTIDKLITNKPPTGADEYTFTATAPTVGDLDVARAEVEKINVWPNPYFGFNTQELNKYQRFVTFNHLPQRATIRIYTLAGIPVRTIEKNDASQFATWDLLNSNKLPVASGMYIIYIDMPDLGKTKVLKLGVIMEAQFLDRI